MSQSVIWLDNVALSTTSAPQLRVQVFTLHTMAGGNEKESYNRCYEQVERQMSENGKWHFTENDASS